MEQKEVVLLLGANLGDKIATLRNAIEEIKKNIGEISLISHLYETAAWGVEDQPTYYNQVIVCSTNHSSETLLKNTQSIENRLGRVRKEKWGARIIDIDILFIENEIIDTETLKVPHPFIQERRFTLEPLVEILPNFIHPILKKTNKDLLLHCKDPLKVEKLLRR